MSEGQDKTVTPNTKKEGGRVRTTNPNAQLFKEFKKQFEDLKVTLTEKLGHKPTYQEAFKNVNLDAKFDTLFQNTATLNRAYDLIGRKYITERIPNFHTLAPKVKAKIIAALIADDLPGTLLKGLTKGFELIQKIPQYTKTAKRVGGALSNVYEALIGNKKGTEDVTHKIPKAAKAAKASFGSGLESRVQASNSVESQIMGQHIGGQSQYTPMMDVPGFDTRMRAYDEVNGSALATSLLPGGVSVRFPSSNNPRTAVAGAYWSTTVSANPSGALSITFFPERVMGSTYLSIQNAADYNPTTGTQTGASTSINGPLISQAVNFVSYRNNGGSIAIDFPMSALNNSGVMHVGYWTMPMQSTEASLIATKVSDMPSLIGYRCLPIRNSHFRWIEPPASNQNNVFNPTNYTGVDYGLKIIITGLPASQSFSLVTGYSVELVPIPTMAPILSLDLPDPGYATIALMDNLWASCQQLAYLSFAASERLSLQLRGRFLKHDAAFRLLTEYLSGDEYALDSGSSRTIMVPKIDEVGSDSSDNHQVRREPIDDSLLIVEVPLVDSIEDIDEYLNLSSESNSSQA